MNKSVKLQMTVAIVLLRIESVGVNGCWTLVYIPFSVLNKWVQHISVYLVMDRLLVLKIAKE